MLAITCFMLKCRFLAAANAAVSRLILLVVPASGVPAHVADPGAAFVVVIAKRVELAAVPPPRKASAAVA